MDTLQIYNALHPTDAGISCVILVNAFEYVTDALYKPGGKFVKMVEKLLYMNVAKIEDDDRFVTVNVHEPFMHAVNHQV